MRIDWLPSVLRRFIGSQSHPSTANSPRRRRTTTRFGGRLEGLEDRALLAGNSLLGLLDLPVATPDVFNVVPGVPLDSIISVLDNDSNPNGNVLDVNLVQGPLHGDVTLNSDGTFDYTPDPGFIGIDIFTYHINDGLLGSLIPGVVTLLVGGGGNHAPVANNDAFTVNEDSLINLTLSVLTNDTDADGNLLTAVLVTPPQHGTLTFLPTGTFIYTPFANYSGPDSFSYQASDQASLSNIATASITVTAVNDAPVANNDNYSTTTSTALNIAAGSGVLANDTDDSGSLTAAIVANPSHGTVSLSANGSFIYTPTTGYTGTDTFTYRASDDTLTSGIATVTISISGTANAPPVATNDNYSIAEDGTLTSGFSVLNNDTVTQPSNGTISFNSNGNFVYTPAPNFSGTDTFTYQANDGTSNSNVATVTITISASNDAPTGSDDIYSTTEGVALTLPAPGVLANDTDLDGDNITATALTLAAHGTVALNPNGSFTYTPNGGFVGTDSFTYQVNDGTTHSAPVTVTIQVNATNAIPVSVNDSYTVAEDGVLTVAATGVLANDTDADSDPLTAVLVGLPQHGTVTLNANGSFVYTPAPDFNGTDSFTYRANDGTANGNLATVNLTITSVGEAPVVTTSPNHATVKGRKKLVLDASTNVTDTDSANLNGGSIRIAIASGAGTQDSISFLRGGANRGRVNVSRGQLRIGRTVIGSVTGGTRGAPLQIQLNSNATLQSVRTALQNVIFKGSNRQAGPRVVTIQVTDDTGLMSNIATKTVDVT
jgi:VCBS repeat-containing protein